MQLDTGPELLRHWIESAARRNPGKPWLICADTGCVVSYAELAAVTRRIAAFLHARGLGRNDRIALLANNSAEHLLTYLGVLAYGATICTVHVEMNRNQLDNIFERLQPRLILRQDGLGLDDLLATSVATQLRLGHFDRREPGSFFDEVLALADGAADAQAQPSDDAVILFTSGTTARPKGVVLNYREHLANVIAAADGFAIAAQDRIYDFRSFNWASAQLLGALLPVCRGATLVMAERFSASRFFPHVHEHGVTVAAGNPTVITMLLNGVAEPERVDLPDLRFLTSSSAPLTVEEWARFERTFGVRIAQSYGSSETGWVAAIAGEERRLGTVGRPLAYHDLAIVDGAGLRLATGETGHVEIGGFADHPYRCLAEDGTTTVTGRGRIRTGDLGFVDAEGFLTLTGREKELIIRGGVNISPVEIDSLLMRLPEVIEAATVGVPDPVYGEEVVAYVVARPGTEVDAEALRRYCTSVLPAFKAPKTIVLASSLPKSARGKLDRRALVERWRTQSG